MNRRHFIASTAAIFYVPRAFAGVRETTVASLDGLGQRVVHHFNERWMGAGTIKAVTILKTDAAYALSKHPVWILSSSSMEEFLCGDRKATVQFTCPNPRTVIAFMPFGFEPVSKVNACKSLVRHLKATGAEVISVNTQRIGETLGPEASLLDVMNACEIWAAHCLKEYWHGQKSSYSSIDTFHA